jgi:hypothetical protein
MKLTDEQYQMIEEVQLLLDVDDLTQENIDAARELMAKFPPELSSIVGDIEEAIHQTNALANE